MALTNQLDRYTLRNLRLVSRLLCSRLNQQVTKTTVRNRLSGCEAKRLLCFPRLTSLVFVRPSTTFHLAALTNLTKISLKHHQWLYPGKAFDRISVDLGSLACLPRLHTLAFQCVATDMLSFHPTLSEVPQLRALELLYCSVEHPAPAGSYQDGPHFLCKLPQLTRLQVADSPLWLSAGLHAHQKVAPFCGNGMAWA